MLVISPISKSSKFSVNSPKKSQIAIEYLIIMSFILFITIPSVLIYTRQSETIKEEVIMSQAFSAIQKISDSSESIFYLGPPSKETIKVYFPERLDNATIKDYEIIIYVGGKGIYVTSKVPLNGTLLATQGIHEIEITAVQKNSKNFVQIIGR